MIFCFKEYFEVVENALAIYNTDCVKQIKQANQMINKLLNNSSNIIKKKFQ